MGKKRTLNELRQTKEYGYKNPMKKNRTGLVVKDRTILVTYEGKDIISNILKLHKSYQNDQEFGSHVRQFLRHVNII